MGETERILNDIRSYMRTFAAATLRKAAGELIDTREKAQVYGEMNGRNTQASISTTTEVPQTTISRWADDFVKAGVASPPNEFYDSHKALFTLDELGIDTTLLRRRASVKQKGETSEPSKAGRTETN